MPTVASVAGLPDGNFYAFFAVPLGPMPRLGGGRHKRKRARPARKERGHAMQCTSIHSTRVRNVILDRHVTCHPSPSCLFPLLSNFLTFHVEPGSKEREREREREREAALFHSMGTILSPLPAANTQSHHSLLTCVCCTVPLQPRTHPCPSSHHTKISPMSPSSIPMS